MSKLKVFFGTNESGVAYWRGKLPAYKMEETGLCEPLIYSVYDVTEDMVAEMVKKCDIAYIPSPCGVDAVCEFITYYQQNKRVIADYDDNLFDCHPYNPAYKTLGLKEVKIRLPNGDEHLMWKDEEKGFSLKHNRMRFNSHIDVLNVVDVVTTTTPYLKNEIFKNVQNRTDDSICIIPNSIDFNVFKPIEHRTKDKIRIGWIASDSHILECRLIKKIYYELESRFKNFELVIMGNLHDFRKYQETMKIEWHNFTDLCVYPLKVASLNLDIALCPLEDESFNRSKSALKWSEMSAFKIPCVLSDVEPYKIINHGIDGFLAKDAKEFADRIIELSENSELRNKMAQNAYDRNFEEYNLDKNIYLWMDVFEKAMNTDRLLTYNGQLIERKVLI